ncbi:MAG: putative ABC transport system ATP-binding protein [Chloroflexi bacterium]|nr:MAG: putative ABC transport system ATP-binding protein [Chloroflexota bacterium]
MKNNGFVRVADLHKDFLMGETRVQALSGVSLEIEQGSFTVVMGPSGSGKSTLLYLIGGLDWPTSGSIHVDGEEIEKMDENSLAGYRSSKVGFVFQSFNLVSSMPAEENVSFPLRFAGIAPAERKTRSQNLLEQVGLSDRATHKPTELSGGQQQRVAIARALINNPLLILADEPTGNLDSNSGLAIMQLLSDLHKSGKTIIVVTHDSRIKQFSTNTIFLLDGKTVSEQTYRQATELMSQP